MIGLLILVSGLPLQSQVFPVKVDRKWGLIDNQGNLLTLPSYQAIHRIAGDHAVVVLDDKYGLLNSAGKEVIPPTYTFLRELSDDLVLLNQGGQCEDGDCEGGKWGIAHLSSETLIEPRFDFIGRFDEFGFAKVNIGGKCDYEDCEGGVWGLLDTLGRIRIEPAYQSVAFYQSFANNRRLEAFIESDSGMGLFDLTRDTISIPPIYQELRRVGQNRLAMQTEDRFGVVDNLNQPIIPAKYEDIQDAGGGYLAFETDGSYGMMDSVGKHILKPRYEKVLKGAYDWVKVMQADRWGLVNMQDEEIVGTVLLGIGQMGPGFAVVQRGTTWGVVDLKGAEIVPTRFSNIDVVNDSLFLVQDRKFYKWYRIDGTIKQAQEFEELGEFKYHLAPARKGKNWGVISHAGNVVVPYRYDKVLVYENVVMAKRGSKQEFFYFDAEGNPTTTKYFVVRKGDDEASPDMSTLGSLGWFYSAGKRLWGLNDPQTQSSRIPPTYTRVELVPGTNLTIGTKKNEDGESVTGLIDHRQGQEISQFIFRSIESGDFLQGNIARCVFNGSSKYGLVRSNGDLIKVDGASYIGAFSEGVARVNVGGGMSWTYQPGIDSLDRRSVIDPESQTRVWEYKYCQGGKWGFIDINGKWMLEPRYESALDYQQGIARVRVDGKWGAVNSSYEFAVKPEFDFIEYLYAEGGKTLLTVGLTQDGIGFMDEKGELVILPQFKEAGEFHEGLVRIRENGLWGYADKNGQVVISPQFREACDFHEGRARVRDRRYWGYIDTQGNQITPQKYLRAGDFHHGLAWVQDGKFFGYIGVQGEMLIEPEFSEADDFIGEIASVKKKSGYGMVDNRGRWKVPARFYRIFPFQDSVAVVQDKGDFGLVNGAGDYIVKPAYREIGAFNEGLAPVRDRLQFGYIGSDGSIRIGFQFPRAEPFSCGLAAVFVNGKWGFIDTTGALTISNEYSKVGNFKEDRAAVRQGDNWGFLDVNGRLAVPSRYHSVKDFTDGRAAVYLSREGWGFVNADGTVVIPTEYEAVGEFQDGLVPVKKDGKWALMNLFGATITSFKYDEIGRYSEGLAKVKVEKKLGVISDRGIVLLDPGYDTISLVGNKIKVEGNDRMGYLDLEGNWIWEPTK